MTADSLSGRSILITGATGFIGVPLCGELQARGAKLTVLTRDAERARRCLGSDITALTQLDQLSPDEPPHTLINLAGEPLASGRWSAARKEEFRRSRIGTTEALWQWFDRQGQYPQRLISGSAIGYYGDSGDQPVTEQAEPGSGFAAELCRDWEASALRFADQDSRVTLLRTGIVLGQGGGALQSMLLPFKMGLGGRLGSGRQWMSWIHRDDIVALILYCLEKPELTGPVNATAPNPVTNRDFTRTLAQTLRRPSLFPAPAFMLRLLMADMADELLLASQRVLPRVALDSGFEFRYPELAPALQSILKSS